MLFGDYAITEMKTQNNQDTGESEFSGGKGHFRV